MLGTQLHRVPLLITMSTNITAAVTAATTITLATTMPAIASALNVYGGGWGGQGTAVQGGGEGIGLYAGNSRWKVWMESTIAMEHYYTNHNLTKKADHAVLMSCMCSPNLFWEVEEENCKDLPHRLPWTSLLGTLSAECPDHCLLSWLQTLKQFSPQTHL